MTPDLAGGIIWYLAFIFSTTVHEAAHALVALKLGDDTAHQGGQVTLDPTPHILREPIGMVVVPLLSYCLGGWMIGWASAPFDPLWAIRNPRRSALMSLAGPASNFLLMILAVILIRAGVAWHVFQAPPGIRFGEVTMAVSQARPAIFFAKVLGVFFSLNLLLCAFNLLPLPPLDGSGVLFFFTKRSSAEDIFRFLQHPTVRLIGLLVAWNCFGPIFGPIHLFAVNHLYPGLEYH